MCCHKALWTEWPVACRGRDLWALSSTPIDMVEGDLDGLPKALLASKDLRVPVKEKRARFARFLKTLMAQHRPWGSRGRRHACHALVRSNP